MVIATSTPGFFSVLCVDEVVQAAGAGGADVHPGAPPHRIETLEDLNRIGAVAIGLLSRCHNRPWV
jgi:hypothetical protein